MDEARLCHFLVTLTKVNNEEIQTALPSEKRAELEIRASLLHSCCAQPRPSMQES